MDIHVLIYVLYLAVFVVNFPLTLRCKLVAPYFLFLAQLGKAIVENSPRKKKRNANIQWSVRLDFSARLLTAPFSFLQRLLPRPFCRSASFTAPLPIARARTYVHARGDEEDTRVLARRLSISLDIQLTKIDQFGY